MKDLIKKYIVDYVKEYEKQDDISTSWREPLVGFADANHKDIYCIREYTFEEHLMPSDILEDPTIIIAYFVPFTKDIAQSNIVGELASEKWILAYQETNDMFIKLNDYLIKKIEEMGYNAAVCEVAGDFKTDILKSKWSHRHIAQIAGLGTFGINNMLITKEGCCGRYFTIVTSLPVSPDKPLEKENCLYKRNKSCLVCVKRCFSGALNENNYDRFKCYDTCMINFDNYENLYGNKKEGKCKPRGGSQVCGKCVVNLPCSFKQP
ncbi:epoxyqueuosine reductase [Terrisporobacter hibernicus]|uniref:Epoxyqueuosine reductase n=1 Tax=Terrisporobacter hibernicus TaxID=2813371 RepID=A0AAX2ZK45_9FIRM|nr:epoxyqueuosine reductase [Terrisporobacter hibernicus]UEL48875.1 epoxyqueuosine reductase [Terrisporobacter hibernicus]